MTEYVRRRVQQKSFALTEDDKVVVQYLRNCGFHNKRIAALFDVNQGRISEIPKV